MAGVFSLEKNRPFIVCEDVARTHEVRFVVQSTLLAHVLVAATSESQRICRTRIWRIWRCWRYVSVKNLLLLSAYPFGCPLLAFFFGEKALALAL
jgi:hypothetical protein